MTETTRTTATGSLREDTIAAISTSLGPSGIGIVRLSGPDAFAIVRRIFQAADGAPLSPKYYRRLRYGWIVEDDARIDEVLVSCMPAPHTYTAEDVAEINTHGGAVSAKRVLSCVLRSGARLAQPGEFTRRAFLNGRIDLTQAEAVMDIIDAKTEQAQAQAVNQLSGELSTEINALKENMLHLLSHVEYAINFMEDAEEDLPIQPMQEETAAIIQKMDALLKDADNGRLIRDGIATVIAGRPNVGKSSLLNALLRQDRAIVTDIPGTTRDAIEENYILDGVCLRLIDTAGIRDTEDAVESIGVSISRNHLAQADIVLAMLDGTRDFSDEEESLLQEMTDKPTIILLNKQDLPLSESMQNARIRWQGKNPEIPWISLSAKEKTGLDALKNAILERIFHGTMPKQPALLSNMRHIDQLTKAKAALEEAHRALSCGVVLDALEVDLRESYNCLADITGERAGEDVLDRIFHDFCVGK